MYTWIATYFSLADDNLNWFLLLLVLLGMSYLGMVGSNFVSRTTSARPHNAEKFLNEWLARSHLSYLSFYTTIFIVGPTGLSTEWVRRGLIFPMILGLIFWIYGLSKADSQDSIILTEHNCLTACQPLPRRVKFKVFGANLLMATISFLLAAAIAFSSIVIKTSHP